MENVSFISCKWEEMRPLVADYVSSNAITIDSFWEEHVIGSRHYKMVSGGQTAGFFAIHGGSAVTLFYVFERFAAQAQRLFARVKKYEEVRSALVATGDEFFLSHCLDEFARIEKQAYFAIYTDNEIPGERRLELNLRRADITVDRDILKLSGDFFDSEFEKHSRGLEIADIYMVEENGELVGFGVIEYGKVLSNIASIGMYVLEKHRRRGVAANILQDMKHIAQARGCCVRSGCWYYNHNSKKSMESAGAYSKTRLVRFYF